MDDKERAKVLGKIQKCLALGKSPNEHEAASAMRQAAKMMERHGVTEKEIGVMGYTKAVIKTTTQCVRGQTLPDNLTCITRLIRHSFGVKAIFAASMRVSDYAYDIEYYGPEHRVMLAEYTHAMIQRAIDQQYKDYILRNPGQKGVRGGRAGFAMGWCRAARRQINEFAMNEEEIIATDLLIGEITAAEDNPMSVNAHALASGAAAGKGFAIHRPMHGAELLKIGR